MANLIETYKGYGLYQPTSGGKAGKGNNRTSNIQVRLGTSIKRQCRYGTNDWDSKAEALAAAKRWIERHPILGTVTFQFNGETVTAKVTSLTSMAEMMGPKGSYIPEPPYPGYAGGELVVETNTLFLFNHLKKGFESRMIVESDCKILHGNGTKYNNGLIVGLRVTGLYGSKKVQFHFDHIKYNK